MTRDEAIRHFLEEFVYRFECSAEGCTERAKTAEAMKVLFGIQKCPCPNCWKTGEDEDPKSDPARFAPPAPTLAYPGIMLTAEGRAERALKSYYDEKGKDETPLTTFIAREIREAVGQERTICAVAAKRVGCQSDIDGHCGERIAQEIQKETW